MAERIVVLRTPLGRVREDRELPEGLTIGEILDEIEWDITLDHYTRFVVDGVEIERPRWDVYLPPPGSHMLVHWLPAGDTAKTVLGAVAMIAIALVAPMAGAAIATAIGAPGLATAISVGITLVGSLVIGALFRPPSPRVAGPAAADTVPSPYFTGQSNQARPYGCIPRVYGTVRVYPNVVGVPFTQNHLGANWLYGLWDFGYGPLQVDDIRIGGTEIGAYAGASWEVLPSWVNGQPIPIYSNDNALESVGIALDFVGQWGERIPSQDANQFVLEFASPAYTIGTADGGQYGPWVIFEVIVNGAPLDPYYASASNTTMVVDIIGGGRFMVHGTWKGDGYNPMQNAFQFSVFYNSPTINPSIRVTRVDEHPRGYPLYAANTTWTALRSTRWTTPVAYTAPHTLIAASFLASNNLSGNIDTLSARCTSILPVRQANGTFVNQPTSNPAWIYLDILRGSATNRPVTDAEIQLADFTAWAAQCDANGFKCSLIWNWFGTVKEALQTVAACGRAAPSMRDGKHTIIVDFTGRVPVQVITPRNSFGLSARMTYLDMPHALKVKYLDETTWLEDEVVAYDDGRNAANSTLFEELRLIGVTNRDQSWRFGRYYIAEGKLRRERVTVSMDVENLIAQRGDLVALVSDTMQVGGRATRIVDIDTDPISGGQILTLQAPLAIAPTALRYRNDDMTGLSPIIPVLGWAEGMAMATEGGDTLTTEDGDNLLAEVETGDASVGLTRIRIPASTGIQVDALAVFGTASVTTGDYLVERIMPGPDLSATLDLIEYRPEIYDADTGPIPPREPKPGIPDTAGTITSFTGYLIPIIVAGRRTYEAVLEWAGPVTAVSYNLHGVDSMQLGDVDVSTRANGHRYQFRAPKAAGAIDYTVVAYNINGAPIATGTLRLTYDPAVDDWPPPPPPADVTVESRMTDLLVSWKEPDYDFIDGYLIRVDGWDNPAAEYRIKGDHIAIPAMREGLHTFYVATVDPQGDMSEQHPSATYTVLIPLQVALAGTAIGNTAFLRWGTLALGDPLWSAATSFNIEYYELAKAPPETPAVLFPFATARAAKEKNRWTNIPRELRWPEGAMLAMDKRKRKPAAPAALLAPSLLADGPEAITTESGDFLLTESGDSIITMASTDALPAEGTLATESGDTIVTEDGRELITESTAPPGEFRPIGRSATEFAMLDEQQPGEWIFAVRAVDIAGNLAPWATVRLNLQAPDNFFMLDQMEDVIPDGGTFANALPMPPSWLMPVRDHTWEEHYADESWASAQDQVDAGFPLYVQPGAAAGGTFSWEHDYGVVMPTVRVTATPVYATLTGAPLVTPLFYTKASAGDAWTLVGPADGSLIVPAGSRYIKIEVAVTAAPGRTGLILLHAVSYLLSVQFLTDQGIATTDSSGEALVDFSYNYNDVRTVQLTSGDEDIKFVRYEIGPGQDSMTIYATDETLAPQSGDVAWLVRGF